MVKAELASSPHMRRRDFITIFGSAAAWPLAARAQQPNRMRRIGVLTSLADDPVGNARHAAFVQGLRDFGWIEGRNARIDTRWGTGDVELSRKYARELVALAPDVILAGAGGLPAAIRAVIQAVSPTLRLTLSLVDTREPAKLERDVGAFAREPNGGLIVAASASGTIHRELIVTLAARHRLPAIYPYSFFVAAGGLISYGPDLVDQYRRAAGYVDRILKGEKPADLPVQAPTKYEMHINLKTAKALGLEIPPTLLARADEVIE
jgi:ABC-type uncharacterized transport system substrate-binding protein